MSAQYTERLSQSNFHKRSKKASEIHELALSKTREKALSSQKNIPKVLQKFKSLTKSYKKNLKEHLKQKTNSMPERLAECINKPGVTSWLHLSSGARLKTIYPNLPASASQKSLNEWETFSGFLGSKRKKVVSPLGNSKNHIDTRGYCRKLDPIQRFFGYIHAMKYLELRNEGVSKEKSIKHSQKFSCDLRNNEEIFFDRKEDDDGFSELERKFGEILKGNRIREGEFVKEIEDVREVQNPVHGIKLRKKRDDKNEKEIKKEKEKESVNEVKENNDSEVKKEKEFWKNMKMKYFRKHNFNPKVSIFEDNELANEYHNSSKQENEPEHENTSKYLKSESGTVLSNGISFKFTSVKPVKTPLPESVNLSNSKLQKNSKVFSQNEVSESESLSSDKTIEKSKHEIIFEKFDPISMKNKMLLDKAKKLQRQLSVKIEETKGKKKLLSSENEKIVKENFLEKMKKIEKVEESRKQQRRDKRVISEIRKKDYFGRVTQIKITKSSALKNELEQVKQKYEERLQNAEKNREELEKNREKKQSDQRIRYDSHRAFVGLMRSFFTQS